MTDFKHYVRKQLTSRSFAVSILVIASIVIIIGCIFNTNVSPFRAFGGAIWFNHGSHYISDAEIADRVEKINAPAEAKIIDDISKTTQSCDTVESGFCEQSPNIYTYKDIITPAVTYQAGTPDTKKVVGYCTLCNDGTFSPSCAVGRGACSYHSGVNAYNVPEYSTIPGAPEVPAQPAVYSYTPKTYQDSLSYIKPAVPALDAVTNFAN